MVICVVPNCREQIGRKGKKWRENRHDKVTFHRIPNRKKELWARSLGLNVKCISKSTRICSCHFHEEMFDRTGSTVRLRENAVPQIHTTYTQTPSPLNFPILELINSAKPSKSQQVYSENNVEQCSSHKDQNGAFNPAILEVITVEHSYVSNALPSSSDKKKDVSMQEDPAINLQIDCILNSSSVRKSIMEVPGDNRIQILTDSEGKFIREISTQTDDYINTYLPTTPNDNGYSHCDEGRNCNNTHIPTTPKGRRWSNCNRGTNTSPTFVFNSPTKVILRNELKNQRLRYAHKIKILRQSQNRKDKRIAELISVIQDLQKKN